jgi:hypothetical protein
VATGPVDVAEVRARLGSAPSATDEDLQSALDVALAHIVPTLDPEWADPATWPDDLHEGILSGAVFTYRNMESPSPAAASQGGTPVVPAFAWDRWVRPRIAQYQAAGAWVG